MEALWPEFDPSDALNSLNQTVYFLRRVFEPDYKDDLSPGYVHHESDCDLARYRPRLVPKPDVRVALMQIARCRSTTQSQSRSSRATYLGPFALDFAYEEWASDYRSVAPHLISADHRKGRCRRHWRVGHFERGIDLARRALEFTPDADQIELSLLRLLRLNGSHSAAAEQYSHYAAAQRETYGIEPPALDTL